MGVRMTAARRAPWLHVRHELKCRRITPREALATFWPSEADRLMTVYTHVMLDDISSTVRQPSEHGVLFAPPRTAVAPIAAEPQRGECSQPVVHLVLLLLSLLAPLTPGKTRVCSRRLYLGDPSGKRAAGLQRELLRNDGTTISRRELERYLAVFRSHQAGPIAWQPKRKHGCGQIVSKKGRPYNIYDWSGLMSAELAQHVAEHFRVLTAAERLSWAKAAVKPAKATETQPSTQRRPQSAAGQQAAADFLAKLDSS